MKKVFAVTAAIVLLGMNGVAQAEVCYTTVDFSSHFNDFRTMPGCYPGLQRGATVLGGVPFLIGENSGLWIGIDWSNQFAPNPRVLEIADLSITGATALHTLINTYWGQPGPTSWAYVEVIGTGGAYYRKNLIGNADIRDLNPAGNWINSINGTTSVNVWQDHHGYRLDKQRISLPTAFASQTITTVRFVDGGGDDTDIWGGPYRGNPLAQRILVAGVTAETVVPEPSSLLALITGAAGLCGFALRRRR